MFHIPAHKNANHPAAQFDASEQPDKPQTSERPMIEVRQGGKRRKAPRPDVTVEPINLYNADKLSRR